MNRRSAILWAMLLGLSGCGGGRRYSGAQVVSPDGSRVAIAEVNESKADLGKYLCVRLKITDILGKVEFEEQTGASVTMRWSIVWEGNDKLILRSSDIGNQAWERGTDGRWKPFPVY